MAAIKGGEKLEAALAKISAGVSKPATLSVGFLSNATYPDGTSVALVAAVNEFGRPDIGQPPRPAFRNMVSLKSPEWPKAVGDLLIANDYDAVKTLSQAGEGIKGQLQQAIADFSGVPLKQSTIDRKGFDKQLVDSGHELASVDYTVKS